MLRELKAFRHSQKIDSMFVRETRGNKNLFYDLTHLIGIVQAVKVYSYLTFDPFQFPYLYPL